jgi:hypothetical protein
MNTLEMMQGVDDALTISELIEHMDQIDERGVKYDEFFSLLLDEAVNKKSDELLQESHKKWAREWGLI